MNSLDKLGPDGLIFCEPFRSDIFWDRKGRAGLTTYHYKCVNDEEKMKRST